MAAQITNISDFGHRMQVSDNINDACNLLGEALARLEDVSAMIEARRKTIL